MQISFFTNHSIRMFSKKNSKSFPDAPERCPFKDCTMPVKLQKHGYYSRFFISKSFLGRIYIRRYICPVCGKTVSMLPMFCIPRFQYSANDIIKTLRGFYHSGSSLKQFIEQLKADFPALERRHINYYRRRITENRKFIQYGLNLISPEFISAGNIPENQKWVKIFLNKAHSLHNHVFIVNFARITGKSFMTSQNMIA